MLASYPEQFHPWTPEQPLAHTVPAVVVCPAPGCAVLRKEDEWEDKHELGEARSWDLLLCRSAQLRKGEVTLLEVSVYLPSFLLRAQCWGVQQSRIVSLFSVVK